MGRALRDAFPAVEKDLHETDELLGRAVSAGMDGPERFLFPRPDSPDLTVPMDVTLALSLAVARALRRGGARPGAAAGRSMGEFSAAAFAGVFGTADCFRMVRAVALEGREYCLKAPSTVVNVFGPDRARLEAIAAGIKKDGHFCEVLAFYDKPRLGVAGLTASGLGELKARLAPFRHRITATREMGAFHSTLFRGLTLRMSRLFRKLPFSAPSLPLYMNLDGGREAAPARIRAKLASAVSRPVRWQETIDNMLADGVRVFVELAPGAMLTEFICALPPDAEVLRTDTPENFRRALRRLAAR